MLYIFSKKSQSVRVIFPLNPLKLMTRPLLKKISNQRSEPTSIPASYTMFGNETLSSTSVKPKFVKVDPVIVSEDSSVASSCT
jgi:hypothetical protein